MSASRMDPSASEVLAICELARLVAYPRSVLTGAHYALGLAEGTNGGSDRCDGGSGIGGRFKVGAGQAQARNVNLVRGQVDGDGGRGAADVHRHVFRTDVGGLTADFSQNALEFGIVALAVGQAGRFGGQKLQAIQHGGNVVHGAVGDLKGTQSIVGVLHALGQLRHRSRYSFATTRPAASSPDWLMRYPEVMALIVWVWKSLFML